MTEPNSIDYSGSNNIEEDPLFEDEDSGDFHLLQNSPCIDAGVAHYEMEDYYGTMVVTANLSAFEFAGFAPDMGCYEYGMTSNDEDVISNTKISAKNYPNPFNPTTTISYAMDVNSYVYIDIYNVKGQKVIELFNGLVNAGNHSVVWDGKDDKGKAVKSGVYFYKIKTANSLIVKKMIMMK